MVRCAPWALGRDWALLTLNLILLVAVPRPSAEPEPVRPDIPPMDESLATPGTWFRRG